ncbi:NADP-binding protein [Dacryopinax primogenitus]|uniref:NADP-binding protein n=1 Tax=Dacryopinax primogenitus (strain DJM 731) TaxID=1858805 RepID=M5G3G9_DACPD|nr:NADP-binding protein [Dacryopinax primogenitus]EJT98307.1 NADP-binding protein [Dacryopinax primogenitus]
MEVNKPVVLITGCSEGGIGYALCEEFAPHAEVVYATARRLEAMTTFKHDNIRTLEMDVCIPKSIEAAVREVIEKCGRLDIVVSNAGVGAFGPILDVSVDWARAAFDTNYFGSHRLAQAVLPHMFQRKSGKFILVGSIGGLVPVPWNGTYAASKAALHTLADVLRHECTPFNVQVMTLLPGFVKSHIIDNMHGFNVSPTSVYQPWNEALQKRFSASQTNPSCMPTKQFAKIVVKELLRKELKWFFYSGGYSTWMWFMTLWPRKWALQYFWRRNSK